MEEKVIDGPFMKWTHRSSDLRFFFIFVLGCLLACIAVVAFIEIVTRGLHLVGGLITISVLLTIAHVLASILIFNDAKNRGMEAPAIWILLVFVLSILSIIIYLSVRPRGNLEICPRCKNNKLDRLYICPHCKVPERLIMADRKILKSIEN